MTASSDTRATGPTDSVAIDTRMCVEVSKDAGANTFEVVLIRRDHRYFDDDPRPDIIETRVCEMDCDCSLPALFDAVEQWLLDGHRLRALPHSWRVGACSGTTGYELLLDADALPIRPIARCD